jgi:hypothetical protein
MPSFLLLVHYFPTPYSPLILQISPRLLLNFSFPTRSFFFIYVITAISFLFSFVFIHIIPLVLLLFLYLLFLFTSPPLFLLSSMSWPERFCFQHQKVLSLCFMHIIKSSKTFPLFIIYSRLFYLKVSLPCSRSATGFWVIRELLTN